jgi:hypothetical protein
MLVRPHVVLATPCYGGLVTQAYLHSILKLTPYAAMHRIGLSLRTANDSLIPRGRNAMLAEFLDTPGATHLMFVDADIGFDPETFGRLLAFDQDVVAGMYPIKTVDWSRTARSCMGGQVATVEQLREAGLQYVGTPMEGPEREERGGFVTARYAGTGFMLIKRSVIERMGSAHPELQYQRTHVGQALSQTSDHLVDLFSPLIEPESRTYLSEDYSFCHRWRALGGKVWLDARARLKHVGSYEYLGTPALQLAPVDLPKCA